MTSYRELAYQIAEQFRVLGKPLGLRDCIVVGGMGKTATTEHWSGQWCWCEDIPASLTAGYLTDFSHSWILCPTLTLSLCLWTDMVSQALELSNQPHVVVATPGRLADHIRSSSTFSMSKIQFLVRATNCSLTGLPHIVSLEITACLRIQTITLVSFYCFDIGAP